MEILARRRSGEAFPVEVTISGSEIDSKWYVIGIFKDITQRRKTESDLRESEEKFKNLAERSPNMIFINSGGRIVYANKMCEDAMGYTRREFYNASFNFFRLIAPEYHSLIAKNYRLHNAGRDVPPYEYALLTKNRKRVECIITTRLVYYGGSNAILGIVTDITARKKAEDEIQRSKAYLERIIASLDEALFIIDPHTRLITMCNPAVEKIFGYKPHELTGRTTKALHIDAGHYDKFRSQVMPALKKRGYFKGEFEMKRKDGAIMPTEHTVTLITDEKGRWIGSVSVVEDITLRKRTQEWVAQYQRQLRTLASQLSTTEERERRHLAKKLHDNVGQELALAKIKLGFLRKTVDPGKQLIVNDIRQMIEKCIKQIRSFTFELSPPILYEVGLEAALEWLADETEKESGIKIKLICDKKPKPLTDEMRVFLFSAVRELLVNVVKHAQAHHASVSVKRKDGDIIIVVRDDGHGIKAFDVKLLKKGGYGLFSIRERLNLYGGNFEIDSMPKRGTRISIRCPLTPV
jgi:PAS domain S-box-containing protein